MQNMWIRIGNFPGKNVKKTGRSCVKKRLIKQLTFILNKVSNNIESIIEKVVPTGNIIESR